MLALIAVLPVFFFVGFIGCKDCIGCIGCYDFIGCVGSFGGIG